MNKYIKFIKEYLRFKNYWINKTDKVYAKDLSDKCCIELYKAYLIKEQKE